MNAAHQPTPFQGLESFDAPEGVTLVRLTSDELTALCPLTGHPDRYHLVVTYWPTTRCLETKSFKLYLEQFRNESVYCEALSAQIARELREAIDAETVQVELTQSMRGGVTIEAHATVGI